ncbi:MAG: discoidin domain-containing protein [Bacteroidia bacterium]
MKMHFFLRLYMVPMILIAGYSLHAQPEIAKGKPATQSSDYHPTLGQAGNAVDGNTSGVWANRSVTHTLDGGSAYPWWEVDLGEDYQIQRIEIWNRTDCCANRMNNMEILVKDESGNTTSFLHENYTYRADQTYPLTFTNEVTGRYVRIRLNTDYGILSLAEVKVYGNQTSVPEPDPYVYTDLGRPDPYRNLLNLEMINHSDWKIRYCFVPKYGGNSDWVVLNPNSSKGDSYFDITELKGVQIQWLDIVTWKTLNNMAYFSQYGQDWKFTVTGRVFPYQAIDLK